MEQKIIAFQQAAQVLPARLREEVLVLPLGDQERGEELRLRVGRPMTVVLPEGEQPLGDRGVTPRELNQLLEIATRASVHAVLPQLREGYLTIAGGHRLGLCGTAAVEEGLPMGELSSVCIRVARQFPGAAGETAPRLFQDGRLQSTLIVSPPGGGKTSFLRDLIRVISEGEGVSPMRVGVADSRGELGAAEGGVPQLDLGRRTDLLTGGPKARGLTHLLRSMSPQVLAVDEVTASEDVEALLAAGGCGVALLATAHAMDRADLERRSVHRALLHSGLFRRLVTIRGQGSQRFYEVEALV